MVRCVDKKNPNLHSGEVTWLFLEIKSCTIRGLNPLEYFVGPNETWQSCKGRAMKILLIAYDMLIAEEEKYQVDEMKSKNNQNGN